MMTSGANLLGRGDDGDVTALVILGASGNLTHHFAEGPSSPTITVTATDEDGQYSTTLDVTVNNVAPTADAGGPYSADQGGSLSLDGSASSDPGADIVAYERGL